MKLTKFAFFFVVVLVQFVCVFALMAAANAIHVVDEPYGHALAKPAITYASPYPAHGAVVGVEKEIFAPAYASPVVHKPLSAYATPVVHKAVYEHHDHHPHYAYDPHNHHMPVYSHAPAYQVAAKAIEYAPVATAHVAPAHVSHAYTTDPYAHGHAHVSHYGKTIVSPHSHVEKYDTRITNDHLYKVATPVVAAAPVHAVAPVHAAVAPVHAVPTHYAKTGYSDAATVAHATFSSSDAHYSW